MNMEEFSDEVGDFSGLGESEVPVTICQTRTLDPVLSLYDALPVLAGALIDLEKRAPPSKSGIIRIQVSSHLFPLCKWSFTMVLIVVIYYFIILLVFSCGDRCLYLRASKRCNGSKANPKLYAYLEHTSLLELLEGTRMEVQRSIRVLQRLPFKKWTTATSVPLVGSVQQSISRITDNSLEVIGLLYKGTSHRALAGLYKRFDS